MEEKSRRKGFQRAVALILVAAAVIQMVSAAFVKPDKK